VEIEQTQQMLQEAQKAHNKAIAKMYEQLRNLLYSDAQSKWERVCREMHERNSWAEVNGQVTEGRCPRTWMSFQDWEMAKLFCMQFVLHADMLFCNVLPFCIQQNIFVRMVDIFHSMIKKWAKFDQKMCFLLLISSHASPTLTTLTNDQPFRCCCCRCHRHFPLPLPLPPPSIPLPPLPPPPPPRPTSPLPPTSPPPLPPLPTSPLALPLPPTLSLPMPLPPTLPLPPAATAAATPTAAAAAAAAAAALLLPPAHAAAATAAPTTTTDVTAAASPATNVAAAAPTAPTAARCRHCHRRHCCRHRHRCHCR
jgi:hypothetical protein